MPGGREGGGGGAYLPCRRRSAVGGTARPSVVVASRADVTGHVGVVAPSISINLWQAGARTAMTDRWTDGGHIRRLNAAHLPPPLPSSDYITVPKLL